jgi:hypothetical protein
MADEQKRESGQPGGCQGRVDEVGGSGVFPMSASEGASDDAEVRGEMGWGQGERGAAGYEDSGGSEQGEIRPEGFTSGPAADAGGDTGNSGAVENARPPLGGGGATGSVGGDALGNSGD